MRTALSVAADILREALARRWFLGLGCVLTLLLAAVALGLRMDIVDGALAATRLFGDEVGSDIRPAGTVMARVFESATYFAFHAGLAFGVVSCSDFGPELLAPGRIEHLLSLPVRRLELLLGTFLGVLGLCLLGTLYGAGGFFLILCAKSGVWTWQPFLAMTLAPVAFVAIYACMLTASVFARSASLSAAAGGLLYVLGLIAGQRDDIAALLEPGFSRSAFLALSAPLPRFSELADGAAALALGEPAPPGLLRLVAGALLFGGASLAVGAWWLEDKDF